MMFVSFASQSSNVIFSSGAINYSPVNGIICGVNYLSSGYAYTMSESVLHRDFQLFEENNVNLIYVNPNWIHIETSIGSYSSPYLTRIRRACEIAGQYGIEVGIAFMTNCRYPSNLTIPRWVENYSPYKRSFETVLRNLTVRQAWLNMLEHVASYLGDLTNIHSWLPIDEPYFGASWAVDPAYVSVDDFINLWYDAKNAIRSYSVKPFAIRFSSDGFEDHFHRDPRLYDLNDYICLNWYRIYQSASVFRSQCTEIHSKGKEVYVGGCGDNSEDDATQANYIRDAFDFFVENGVDGALAWFWESNGEYTNYWNLVKNSNGEPRQAFYVLAGYNT